MLEARVTKSIVVQDEKTGGTVLMGVAEYCDEKINFKVAYDWRTLDHEGFLTDLRETLAEGFDLPVYRVQLEHSLLTKMRQYAEWNTNTSGIIH